MLVERQTTPVLFVACEDKVGAIRDPTRPGIERYRRRDQIDALLPVE